MVCGHQIAARAYPRPRRAAPVGQQAERMTAAERALTLSRRMSPIGLGTARGAEDGATVLGTAVNYRRGRSERAVGEALRRAITLGVTSRDRVVVSTKVGYPRPDGGVASSAPGPESHDPTT